MWMQFWTRSIDYQINSFLPPSPKKTPPPRWKKCALVWCQVQMQVTWDLLCAANYAKASSSQVTQALTLCNLYSYHVTEKRSSSGRIKENFLQNYIEFKDRKKLTLAVNLSPVRAIHPDKKDSPPPFGFSRERTQVTIANAVGKSLVKAAPCNFSLVKRSSTHGRATQVTRGNA